MKRRFATRRRWGGARLAFVEGCVREHVELQGEEELCVQLLGGRGEMRVLVTLKLDAEGWR